MPAHIFNRLWKAIDVLESQEQISSIRAIQYPNLTKAARTERDKKLYAAAYPRDIYKKEAKDAAFLVQKLGGKDGRRK
jgi:hypothetical protein